MKQTAMKQTACTNCGKRLKYREELSGKMARCPQCDQRFRLGAVNPVKTMAETKTRPIRKKATPAKASKAWIGWALAGVGLVAVLGMAGWGGFWLLKKMEPATLGERAVAPTPPSAPAPAP